MSYRVPDYVALGNAGLSNSKSLLDVPQRFPFYGPKCDQFLGHIDPTFHPSREPQCSLPKGHLGPHYDFVHRCSPERKDIYWLNIDA